MAEGGDPALMGKVQGLGFNHPDPSEWMKPTEYTEVQKAPDYRPEFDLFIAGPDGEYVSRCIIWFDDVNKIGFFEPVCTHPDFRRRGFGREVMLEGIRRVAACEILLNTTRDLLLAEQQQVQRHATTFPAVFGSGYPEFKADVQHLMLACERHDMFALKGHIISVCHELMVHIAQALTGVEYSGFNSLADYEQNLGTLGFPELLPYALAQDFDGLARQCQAFDRRLQAFLTEHGVSLNAFDTFAELQKFLEGIRRV